MCQIIRQSKNVILIHVPNEYMLISLEGLNGSNEYMPISVEGLNDSKGNREKKG